MLDISEFNKPFWTMRTSEIIWLMECFAAWELEVQCLLFVRKYFVNCVNRSLYQVLSPKSICWDESASVEMEKSTPQKNLGVSYFFCLISHAPVIWAISNRYE
jgi:hypothetical protein